MRAAALVAVALLTACGGQPAPVAQQGLSGEVVVFAAASLTDVMTRVADDVERENPGATVTLNLGGSPGLAQAIVSGAPADVFAAASPATMAVVVDAGEARGEPAVFARNALQIAVPTGNPGGVRGLADFARAPLRLAACAEQVPCGAAAVRAFAAAGVTPRPDTLEQDVRAVLTKVRTGEVDAGLVYVTDVVSAAGEVEGVELPPAQRASADYPVVALRGAPNPALAEAFVAALLGSRARALLADAGFLPPS